MSRREVLYASGEVVPLEARALLEEMGVQDEARRELIDRGAMIEQELADWRVRVEWSAHALDWARAVLEYLRAEAIEPDESIELPATPRAPHDALAEVLAELDGVPPQDLDSLEAAAVTVVRMRFAVERRRLRERRHDRDHHHPHRVAAIEPGPPNGIPTAVLK